VAPRGTYRKIADDLRRQVAAGDLLPGALVPSELILVEQHQTGPSSPQHLIHERSSKMIGDITPTRRAI